MLALFVVLTNGISLKTLDVPPTEITVPDVVAVHPAFGADQAAPCGIANRVPVLVDPTPP